MDAVKSFNAELSSLYDVKPPISKAKMTALTRGAIKAIKFYKHVVQSVEKFILKCKPEYKIPGLYVIDSIVRQSRHQFGVEKDVFAPRFAKNIQQTFVNLFRCPPEDKSKIIRVLNLWQKNNVFQPEVIQPLFDLADSNHPLHKEIQQQQLLQEKGESANGILGGNKSSPSKTPQKDGSTTGDQTLLTQLQQFRMLMQQKSNDQTPQTSNNAASSVKFDKKLLDFDYGSDDDDDKNTSPLMANSGGASQMNTNSLSAGIDVITNILKNPDLIRQLQTITQLTSTQGAGSSQTGQTQNEIDEKVRKIREMKQQEEEFDRHLAQTIPNLPFAAECELKPPLPESSSQKASQPPLPPPFDLNNPSFAYMQQYDPQLYSNLAVFASNAGNVNLSNVPSYSTNIHNDAVGNQNSGLSQISQNSLILDDVNNDSEIEFTDDKNPADEVINLDQDDSRSPQTIRDDDSDKYEHRNARRRRSRSRAGRRSKSRDRRDRRRSRSRSRSRDRRKNERDDRHERRRGRSRSRSRERRKGDKDDRERDREREREREKERERDKEKERERKKRGLPPIKKDNMSVCTTTLWVGHLSKLVTQEELSNLFGEIGDVVSIDLIHPRGCAFIVMNRRQDAARCLTKLRDHKLHSKSITLAWAPGKGVKSKQWKDYWEVDYGVSYIPWSKLNISTNLEDLEEGGMIDEETMPKWLKDHIEQSKDLMKIPGADGNMLTAQMIPPGVVPAMMSGGGMLNNNSQASVMNALSSQQQTGPDTSQPPPIGIPPPMSLSMVAPFALNMMHSRGAVPTSNSQTPAQMLPPGMMPPPPLGVPPPNMTMLNNLNQFGQVLLPHMQAPPPNLTNPIRHVDMRNTNYADDMMDVEMEDAQTMAANTTPVNDEPSMSSTIDASKPTSIAQLSLSEQLLASIGNEKYRQDVDDRSNHRDPTHKDRSMRNDREFSRDRDRRGERNDRDIRNDRGDKRRREPSRERGNRNRERSDERSNDYRYPTRDGDRGNRPRGPERLDTRSRDSGGSSGTTWPERGRDRDVDGDRPRKEKSLSERLQEMANEGVNNDGTGRRSQAEQAPPSIFDVNVSRPKSIETHSQSDSEFDNDKEKYSQDRERDTRDLLQPRDEDNRRNDRFGNDRFTGNKPLRQQNFGSDGGKPWDQPYKRKSDDSFSNHDENENFEGNDNLRVNYDGPPGGPPPEFFGPPGGPKGGPGGPSPMFGGGPNRPMPPFGPPMNMMGGPPQGPPPFGPRGPMNMNSPHGPPPHMFNMRGGRMGNMRPPMGNMSGPPWLDRGRNPGNFNGPPRFGPPPPMGQGGSGPGGIAGDNMPPPLMFFNQGGPPGNFDNGPPPFDNNRGGFNNRGAPPRRPFNDDFRGDKRSRWPGNRDDDRSFNDGDDRFDDRDGDRNSREFERNDRDGPDFESNDRDNDDGDFKSKGDYDVDKSDRFDDKGNDEDSRPQELMDNEQDAETNEPYKANELDGQSQNAECEVDEKHENVSETKESSEVDGTE